ncbi:MAG: glycosyltransferase family 2 protein [Chloroflexota bacterium]|nr:MAG: glycosyltransferase family 2 protein [Chloroflexota bacterium]
MKDNPKGIFCSTIIPTINRGTLTTTVHSVLDQAFKTAEHQVIVVNDSGTPLPYMEWHSCERVRIVDTNRRERSIARNTGAAVAKGDYLHFLDDDDILLPGALEVFWQLAQNAPSAAWLYGSYRNVDNEGRQVHEFHPAIEGNLFPLLVSGEGIPLQVSLLRAKEFRAVGGFDPNPVITGVEDRDLGRRIALIGTVAYSPTVVGQIRIGEQGSTTNWSKIAEGDRVGREKALGERNAFSRIRSGITSDYWRGRVSRAWFASAVWNAKRRNIATAASRGINGLATANWHWIAPSFWKGLKTKIV